MNDVLAGAGAGGGGVWGWSKGDKTDMRFGKWGAQKVVFSVASKMIGPTRFVYISNNGNHE